jgi:hypothetical protein
MKGWSHSRNVFPVGSMQGAPVLRLHPPLDPEQARLNSMSYYLDNCPIPHIPILADKELLRQPSAELYEVCDTYPMVIWHGQDQYPLPTLEAYRIMSVDGTLPFDVEHEVDEVICTASAKDMALFERVQKQIHARHYYLLVDARSEECIRSFVLSDDNNGWRMTRDVFGIVSVEELERMFHGQEAHQ